MGILRTFLRDNGYWHKSEINRTAVRAYAAATMGRLTGDWITTATTIDHDIRSGMLPVRSRARDLSQNSEFAKAYLRAIKKNVVGSEGFALQVQAVDYVGGEPVPDELANSMIEDAFDAWSAPDTATVTGGVSQRKVEELLMESVARDGEAFVYMLRGRGINRFGFSQQLIEPDYIDHTKNEDLRNGNIIRMGIELNPARRPVAYHISERNATLELYGTTIATGPYRRVPASDIIHLYDPERIDQTRGISWMAPAMLGLHNLKGYVEAAIINARAGANKLGFFRDPSGDGGEYTGDTTDASGEKIATCEPGTFDSIGRLEFQGFDPKYPEAQFDPFVKAILRGISSALGISYQTLTNDLLGTSYASGRVGLLEERETYKSMQAWFTETYLNRIFPEWLFMALSMGTINLPLARFQKFNKPKWTGRRWAWVDPLKDIEAMKQERGACLKSSTMIANESGRDLEEIYQEIAKENKLAAKYGLMPDYSSGGKSNGDKGTEDTADGMPDDGMPDVQPRPVAGKGNGKVGRPRLLV